MKKLIVPIVMIALTGMAGCSNSDYRTQSAAVTPPPTGGAPTDFTSFVITQFAPSAQSETALPVQVDAVSFQFADQDNPAAFTSITAAAP